LSPFLDEIFRILATFDSFSIWHVYRERNEEENALSKEGLRMDFWTWMILEAKDGSEHAFYHRPFKTM
jgi:hypothetical protein